MSLRLLDLLLLYLCLVNIAGLKREHVLSKDTVAGKYFVLRQRCVLFPDLVDFAIVPVAHAIKVNITAVIAVNLADMLTLVRNRTLKILLRLLLNLSNSHRGM